MDRFDILFHRHNTGNACKSLTTTVPTAVKTTTNREGSMPTISDTEVELLSDSLRGKSVLVGITGGIAAVESVKVLREIRRHGAKPTVIMTKSACEVISPLAVEWAANSPVISKFDSNMPQLERYDAVLICPATRNFLSLFDHGVIDTPLLMACSSAFGAGVPVMVVPSMHGSMASDPKTQSTCENLESKGVKILWGERGEGKLKQPDHVQVTGFLCNLVNSKESGRKSVVVTLGATRSAIDSVRFIQNTSSGKTGSAIANYLYRMGHRVTTVSGVTNEGELLWGIVDMPKEDPFEMLDALKSIADSNDIDAWVHAAAVLDYGITNPIDEKVASGSNQWDLHLESLPKHLSELREMTSNSLRIGFKLEVGIEDEELLSRAKSSMEENSLDYVVANHLSKIRSNDSRAILVNSNGSTTPLNDEQQLVMTIESIISGGDD